MKLFNDENIISVSNGDKLTLTNHRVKYEYSNPSLISIIINALQGNSGQPSMRNSSYITIFLEQITSIEYRYKSSPIWIGLAVISLLGGFYSLYVNYHSTNSMIPYYILAFIFIVIYFLTRKSIIAINTAGGVATIYISAIHRDIASDIIFEIETAKHQRVKYLNAQSEFGKSTTSFTNKPFNDSNKCDSCGTINAKDDVFCMSCGNKLK